MNYAMTLLPLILLSCSIGDEAEYNVPQDESPQMSGIEISPIKLQDDTISTLGLSDTLVFLSWESLKTNCSEKGYKVYQDRFDEDGVYGIYVGWDREHSIFRSYKVVVEKGAVKKIEARYSYKVV